MAAITLAGRFAVYTRADLAIITLILTVEDIADISLELSEREIYNDVRSVTMDTTGFEEAYSTKAVEPNWCDYSPHLAPGETQEVTVFTESGDSEITWLGIMHASAYGKTLTGISEASCLALGGKWKNVLGGMCSFGDMSEYLSVIPTGQTANSFTFEVTNEHATLWLTYHVQVQYRYLAERRILVRSTDESSIAKYGRRVMNLTWELGQEIATQQQIVDSYVATHSEPVPLLVITVQGKTDRLIDFILYAKINDLIRIYLSELGINHDYWITQLAPTHRTDGMLEADLQLEQIRTDEEVIFWEWDTSLWDGDHVWSP